MIISIQDKSLCQFCKKHLATKLCDMPLMQSDWCGHPPKINETIADGPMKSVITCDALMCEYCVSAVTGAFDVCPNCKAKYFLK